MTPNVAKIAALIGDAVRARMLFALLDGRELNASELAHAGGASAQAASAHLAKLVDGRLIDARSEGRQRLFKLASEDIAHAVEALASIAPATQVHSLTQHSQMQRLRHARSCYDHLAGQLGVSITEALVARAAIMEEEKAFKVTSQGESFFGDLGIDVAALRATKRHFARACLDWTERRHHVAGALGAALLDHALRQEWVARNARDRSLRITRGGEKQFTAVFGLTLR